MALYSDQGIVLRTMRYGEADRIITLLTQSHGKMRAIIKGVRKTKSRFGASVEPFSHVDVVIYEGRSELRIISQADLLSPFDRIRSDFDAYTCAQVMCESTDRVAPDGEPNVRLVLLLLSGLRCLDDLVRSKRLVPHVLRSAYLLKLLGITGFGPSLKTCVHCGGDDGLVAFSIGDGGVLCGACREPSDVSIGADGVKVLRVLWTTVFADIGDIHSAEVDGLVRRLVEYHLERRLRSLELAP